jgi:HK97 family phage prohead protease
MTGAHAAPPGGAIRTVSFRVAQVEDTDGRTLEGYAAVFNSPTRIDSMFEGTFDEQIKRGAFKRYLTSRMPTLMFEHGQHPLIGGMPLGVIERATEDANGLFIRARLSDNWLIQPVRDAVRDGAVTGMSFRFMVPRGGDVWQERTGDVPLRTLTDVDVPELGPVVFPAYEPTTVAVRSAFDSIAGRLPAGSGRGGDIDARTESGTTSKKQDNRARLDHESLRLRGVV